MTASHRSVRFMPAAAAPIGSRLVSSTRAPWRCGMRRGVIAEQARSSRSPRLCIHVVVVPLLWHDPDGRQDIAGCRRYPRPASRETVLTPNADPLLEGLTMDGRSMSYTREALVMRVAEAATPTRSSPSSSRSWWTRGAPCYLRCDDGPEFIAAALSDWCRFSGTDTVSSSPAHPGRTLTWSRSTPG